MPRTQIDADQIQDETITGNDIKDGAVQRRDLDTTTIGESVITKVVLPVNSGLEITSTGADSGTGDVEIKFSGGNFGTQYYAYQNTTESSTTSNAWVLKAQVSTPVVPSGKYIIHYRAQLTNSQKKTVGFQVNWRSLGFTPFVTIEESFNEPVSANVFETRAAFEEVIVNNDSQIDIQVQWGQTTGGGVGKIKNVSLYLFKVGEV